MGDELASVGAMQRGGERDLDAELVGAMGFSLADALDFWGMERIELAAPVAPLLRQHPAREIELAPEMPVEPGPIYEKS